MARLSVLILWWMKRSPLLLAILLVLCTGSAPAQAQAAPAEVVTRFHETLLVAMKQGPDLGWEGRTALLGPVVERTFALASMARLAVGSQGTQLSAAQMDALTAAFRDWTVANYAANFRSWAGERFETGEPRPSAAGTVLVPSRIIPDGGEPTRLDYLLRETGGGWKAIDVLAEGSVSQLAVRRSEFVSTLRREGFDGLIALLRRRTADLAGR